jgi:type IV secretory pathway VirB9-like protein
VRIIGRDLAQDFSFPFQFAGRRQRIAQSRTIAQELKHQPNHDDKPE